MPFPRRPSASLFAARAAAKYHVSVLFLLVSLAFSACSSTTSPTEDTDLGTIKDGAISNDLWADFAPSPDLTTPPDLTTSPDQASPHATGAWHMIDVNSTPRPNTGEIQQGDAHLLLVGDTTLMIDAGADFVAAAVVIPYLASLGIDRINHFFLSHPHSDHCDGLESLVEHGITIDKLYYRLPPPELSSHYDAQRFASILSLVEQTGTELITPQAGFVLDLPQSSSLEILYSQEDILGEAGFIFNDLSFVMKWRVGSFDVLFTGDLGPRGGEYLMTDPAVKADLLKVPHHAATAIAANTFFDHVDPMAVLVPGPEWVWCGPRGDQVNSWVAESRRPVWVNGLDGHVVVEFDDSRATITPATPSASCKLSDFGTMTLFK